MGELRSIYIHILEEAGHPNDKFRSGNLKAKLGKHEINTKIKFARVSPGDKGCISYNVVYSADITVEDAISRAYKLGARQEYLDVAYEFREEIQEKFKESEEMPWPMTGHDFEEPIESYLPEQFLIFMNTLVSGEKTIKSV